MTDVGQDPTLSADAASRLRTLGRSRRFALGRPRDFAPALGGLLFLRSLAADDPVTGLWSLNPGTGAERLLADPRELRAGRPEEIPAAESRRRERMRESARGIVAYSISADGRLAAFALSGRPFVCDVVTGSSSEIPVTGPAVDPRLSPDGTALAYLSGRTLLVTRLDGRPLLDLADEDPEVSFGAAEFGAAEEMDRHHGYWWSPDGTRLLAARVSEHDVASWWLGDPTEAAAEPYRQRYPFAGTANPEVRLLLVALDGARADVELPYGELPYVHQVRWDGAGTPLVTLHARDHGRAEVWAVEPGTGATRRVHADADPAWLELIPGTPRWLADGGLLASASSAGTHRIVIDGRPMTPAGLQLISVAGQAGDRIIFCATDEPTERHVYALDPCDQAIEKLTTEPGMHSATVLGDLLAISSETLEADGLTVRIVGSGATREVATVRSLPQPTFAPGITLLRAGMRELRTAVILPRDAVRPSGPLPVVMDPYGGPTQRVLRARRLFYEPQWLADQGFAVIVADGRGSHGRGPAWEREIRFDVASAGLDDQVAALEHVVRQYPGELDAGHVGIRGWSFGGYFAALAVLRRPDVFAAAIAGAPVTDWRWYDTVATERYLGLPGQHPEAYERSSLFPLAAGLTRPLLLVHGLADDNVHPRHSLLLAKALLAAGREHEVLLLPGVTHMAWQPEVIEQLLGAHVRFFRRWLAPGPEPGRACGAAVARDNEQKGTGQ
jgi:dipeptidyl-peptidase 4